MARVMSWLSRVVTGFVQFYLGIAKLCLCVWKLMLQFESQVIADMIGQFKCGDDDDSF